MILEGYGWIYYEVQGYINYLLEIIIIFLYNSFEKIATVIQSRVHGCRDFIELYFLIKKNVNL